MNDLNSFDSLIPKPRDEIISMNAYSAPLENRRNLLRLDFNENTLGPSIKVLNALKNIKLNEIAVYPEYSLLKKTLYEDYFESKRIKINQIGIFNGADAAINAIFNSYGQKNQFFLTTNPTFGYYAPCAEMRGMKTVTSSYLGSEFLFPIKDFETKIKQYNPKIVFICNPNNPTGSVLSAKKIIELANLNKNSLIVVDELYEKFLGDSVIPIIDFEKTKNIVILQSLSKTAGLAGLRMGFAFGNNKVIEYIKKVTGPYDVNSFAVIASIAAIKDKSYIENYVKKVLHSRDWIKQKFESNNIKTHFSGGNYFLLWPNLEPQVLEKKMRERGILIRSMAKKKDLDKCLRVSIGTKEQMQIFWENYNYLDSYNN